MMVVQRDDEPNSFACVCVERSKVTCGPDVDGFSVPGVSDDFGSDIAERTGERVARQGSEKVWLYEKDEGIKGWEMNGGLTYQSRRWRCHCRGPWSGRGCLRVCDVGEKTERERKPSVLEVLVDDAVAVNVVNGTKNRADDDDNIMLGKLALCEDAVKQLPASSKFKGEIVFYARLKALVKLDLGLV